MKKIKFLFLIFIVLFSTNCLAATQTINTLPDGNATFITDLQTFLQQEQPERDQLLSPDKATIVSGGIGATSASLVHTLSTCTGFPNNYYVSQSSVSHTYTANKRTFVYLRDNDTRTITIAGAAVTYDGYFVFAEFSAATARTADPTGTLALMQVDTDGTSITTVDELNFGKYGTVTNLRYIPVINGKTVVVGGYYTPGDGVGGPLRFGVTGASAGTYIDNGGSIIVPVGGDGSAAWIYTVGDIGTVDTIGDLRDLVGYYSGQSVIVRGYYVSGDGGGGPLRIVKAAPSGGLTDNGGNIIKPGGTVGDAIGEGELYWTWEWSGSVYVEWFGVNGDDEDEDTSTISAAFNSKYSIACAKNKTYIIDYVTVSSVNNIVVQGNNSTIKRLPTSTGADFNRGGLISFTASNNITIRDLIFDGNRETLIATTPANVSMNNGLSFYGNTANGSDVLLDGGGETKGSKNIVIQNCKFYRTGSTGVGSDKKGDGIFLFGVDGVTIKDCYFEDMGRWAIAGGDVFNVTISDNIVKNSTSGTYATALGSFDIENEAADTTNGSYSRGIRILNNKVYGRASMYINVRATVYNAAGLYHYVKDIDIIGNTIENYFSATYGEAGIYAYVTSYGTTYPEFSFARIDKNTIKSTAVTPLTYGILVYPNTSSITTSYVSISDNKIIGCNTGIATDSTSMPILTDYKINGNSIISGFAATGDGIYCEAREHRNVSIDDNYISGYAHYGIGAIRQISGSGMLKICRNAVYNSAAMTIGIAATGDVIIVLDNYLSNTTGIDYSIDATTKIIGNDQLEIRTVEATLTTSSGATATYTNAIPAGSVVLGLSTIITTEITGPTSIDIGIAADIDRFGVARNVTLGSTTGLAQWTVTQRSLYTAATSVIVTANGGNFTGGAIKIRIHYQAGNSQTK